MNISYADVERLVEPTNAKFARCNQRSSQEVLGVSEVRGTLASRETSSPAVGCLQRRQELRAGLSNVLGE
jgi:hypothetical protein